MPFAYYGAKHGLAAKYPRPRHPLVVEPFAGSAAYSVRHAHRIDRVLLMDTDPALVALWHEIQTMTPADVDRIGKQLDGERFTHPLLAGMAGSTTLAAVLAGKSRTVTPRMRRDWPRVRDRIVRALEHVRRWEIVHAHYREAPDVEATWFVDPPYEQHRPAHDAAGGSYRFGSDAICYSSLADWCRQRRGFVVVCEQSPAAWLPFHPFATQKNGPGIGSVTRHELVWRSDMEQPSLPFGG